MGSNWLKDGFSKLGEIFRDSDWLKENFRSGADADSGMPLSVGTIEGAFLGLNYRIWFAILLVVVVLALLLTVLDVGVRSCSLPSPKAEQRLAPQGSISTSRSDKASQIQSEKTVSGSDRITDFPCESCSIGNTTSPPTKKKKNNDLDEAALQRQRISAIQSGNVNLYNELIKKHKEIYRQNGIDPCEKGFFPEGCQ